MHSYFRLASEKNVLPLSACDLTLLLLSLSPGEKANSLHVLKLRMHSGNLKRDVRKMCTKEMTALDGRLKFRAKKFGIVPATFLIDTAQYTDAQKSRMTPFKIETHG